MLTTTRIATATWNLPLMQLSAGSCHTPLDFIVVPNLHSSQVAVEKEVLRSLMLSGLSMSHCRGVHVYRAMYWHQSLCKLGLLTPYVLLLPYHSFIHMMFNNDLLVPAQLLSQSQELTMCMLAHFGMLLAGQSWTQMGLTMMMA